MGGSDDDDDDDGNLPLLTPRTKAFLSSLLREDPPPPGNGSEAPTPVPDRQNPCLDSADGGGGDAGRKDPGAPKPGLGVGLTERIAARAGFNAPRLDTSQIRSVILGSSPPGVEPYRIPLSPGFSPSAFLDSPVLLFNSLAQPSPTTGKFPLGQCNNTSSLPISETADKNKITILMDADDVKPFAFNSHTGMSSSSLSNTTNKTDVALAQQQLLSSQEASAQPEFSNQAKSLDADPEKQQEDHRMSDFSEPTDRKDRSVDFMFDQKLSNSAIYNKNSSPSVDQREGDVQKGELSLVPVGQPSEDGYNWRKYGQKQVKGSEFPRSYYKCTHPSCQVKKKVERSPEGQVAEIIYKGVHNHSIPPLNHQASVPSSNPIGDRQNDAPERQAVRPITLNGTDNQEWSDRVGASLNVPKTTEFCDPSMSVPMQFVPCFESSGAIDLLSTPSNQDNGEEEDDGAHGNEPLGVDGGDEESELKRRKLEASVADMSSASRAVREPRVVVQTTSEVDILDDGYRWRKYGQKVVKGNPNPRSYYKCTSVGCTVRKHVERASHDLKSVITTYEGKHNHEVPMARNSSHSNTGPSGMSSQSQNVQRRSDPSHAQQKFPVFDTTAALGSFDMLPAGREQLGPSAAISLGLSQPSLTSLAVVGLVPADPMKMLPQVHAYLGQKPMNEPGYAIPKGVVEEQMTKPSLPIPNAGSVHQQIMGRLPLGPEQ